MSHEIIKNPGDLPIIKNPNKPSKTMAKKKTTDQAIDQFSEHAQTALYILGGQAIAAQGNAILVPMALKEQSATVQQVARSAVPLIAGVGLAMFVKNPHVRRLSLGLGTQGVLEAIKLLMPNFNPQEGLADASSYVFTDHNGQQKQAVVTPDGQVVMPDGQRLALPQAKASKKSKTMSEEESEKELSGMSSRYTEDAQFEYV